jgi:hypothetical protein
MDVKRMDGQGDHKKIMIVAWAVVGAELEKMFPKTMAVDPDGTEDEMDMRWEA